MIFLSFFSCVLFAGRVEANTFDVGAIRAAARREMDFQKARAVDYRRHREAQTMYELAREKNATQVKEKRARFDAVAEKARRGQIIIRTRRPQRDEVEEAKFEANRDAKAEMERERVRASYVRFRDELHQAQIAATMLDEADEYDVYTSRTQP